MARKIHVLTHLPNFQGRDPFHEILPSEATSGRLVWHLKVPESVALPSFRVLVWGYQDYGLGARYSTQAQIGIFDWNADPNSPESDVFGELLLPDLSVDVAEVTLQFKLDSPTRSELSAGARFIYEA